MLRRVARSHPRFSALCLGCLLVLALLVAAEGVLRILPGRPRLIVTHTPDFAVVDEWGRSGPASPGEHVGSAVHSQTGELVFRIPYQVDEKLRRITPGAAEPRPRFAAFFGGSFVWGEGVRGDETIPYYFGRLTPDHRPYNYGFGGHGTADMLAVLERGSLRDEISEPRGIFVYVFNDHHVDRTLGTLQLVGSWGIRKPCYELSPDDSIMWRGTFETARPWRSRLYQWLASSRVLDDIVNLDWPLRIDAEHLDFVTGVILRSRTLVAEQFPGSSFWVTSYPGSLDYAPALLARLQERGVSVIDLSGLFDASRPEYHLRADQHPTGLANERFVEALVAHLALGSGADLAFSRPTQAESARFVRRGLER